jgi:hypothetical protein
MNKTAMKIFGRRCLQFLHCSWRSWSLVRHLLLKRRFSLQSAVKAIDQANCAVLLASSYPASKEELACGSIKSPFCSTTTLPVGRTISSARGGQGGKPFHVWCPEIAEIQTIHSIHLNLLGYKYAGSITYVCKGRQTGAQLTQRYGGSGWQRDDLSNYVQSCPASQVATGLNLRYGKHVNAVGLICGTVDP